jgi:hypothetical protein
MSFRFASSSSHLVYSDIVDMVTSYDAASRVCVRLILSSFVYTFTLYSLRLLRAALTTCGVSCTADGTLSRGAPTAPGPTSPRPLP